MSGCEFCENLGMIPNLVRTVINLIKFGVPVLLVIFGMLDLGKAVMAGKEDEMKKAQSTLIKRVIYAVAVFLVVTIVQFVMAVIADADGTANDQSWYTCIFGSECSSNEGFKVD